LGQQTDRRSRSRIRAASGEADWIAKIEFARRKGLPDPHYWPKSPHKLWAWARGHDLRAPTERHIVIVKVIRARIAKAQKRPEQSVTTGDIYASARCFGMSYAETVVAVQEIEAMAAPGGERGRAATT
jgi:hypothetical protein